MSLLLMALGSLFGLSRTRLRGVESAILVVVEISLSMIDRSHRLGLKTRQSVSNMSVSVRFSALITYRCGTQLWHLGSLK